MDPDEAVAARAATHATIPALGSRAAGRGMGLPGGAGDARPPRALRAEGRPRALDPRRRPDPRRVVVRHALQPARPPRTRGPVPTPGPPPRASPPRGLGGTRRRPRAAPPSPRPRPLGRRGGPPRRVVDRPPDRRFPLSPPASRPPSPAGAPRRPGDGPIGAKSPGFDPHRSARIGPRAADSTKIGPAPRHRPARTPRRCMQWISHPDGNHRNMNRGLAQVSNLLPPKTCVAVLDPSRRGRPGGGMRSPASDGGTDPRPPQQHHDGTQSNYAPK